MPKKRTRRKPKVVCGLCGKAYVEITDEHLKKHGFTRTMYARTFDSPLKSTHLDAAPPGPPRGCAREDGANGTAYASDVPAVPGAALTLAVANQLAGEPHFVRALSDEVASAILGGPVRERLRASLVALLTTRLEVHGRSAAALEAVLAEIAQPWRVEQGGEAGGPTPTKDLVALAATHAATLRSGEELVLKAIRLAVEECRAPAPSSAHGTPLDAYRGEHEQAIAAESFSTGERETIRQLLGMLQEGAAARSRLVESDHARPVEVEVRPAPDTAPGASPASPSPGGGDDGDPLSEPATPLEEGTAGPLDLDPDQF